MSAGVACRAHPRTSWRVRTYRGNHSAFNGYRFTPSAYSEVVCIEPGCGLRWRTTAAYVDTLPAEDSRLVLDGAGNVVDIRP